MKRLGALLVALLLIAINCYGCGSPEPLFSEGQNDISGEQGQPYVGTHEQGADTGIGTGSGQDQGTYVQPEMKGEITISCLYEYEFLSVAAKQFMEMYPDVKITINSYQGDSGAGSVENYLTYLNTKIMTGDAEDILLTGFLPVTKYTEMGVFEDLSSYVASAPEFTDEDYFMNVLEAAREDDGSLYIIPYESRLTTVEFSKALLDGQGDIENELRNSQSITLWRAIELAKQMIDETDKNNAYLTHMSEMMLMDYFVIGSLGQFIDVDGKQVNINTSEYIELLESVNFFAENGYFDAGIDYYNEEYYYAATTDFDVQAAFYYLDGNSDSVYCMPIADSDGNVSNDVKHCLALNSASDNKALAWKFIRYLLSEEVQTLPSVIGAPVNRQGFEAWVERYYKLYSDGNVNSSVDKDTYHDVLEGWIDQINDCDTLDSAIEWLIEEENLKYFNGQQTAEVTAQNLQRRLEQYFNE